MTSYVGPLNTLTYSGRAFRLLNSIPLAGATATRPLGSMSGVRPGTPSTTVQVTGSAWTVHPHAGVLDVSTSGLAGPYGYAIDLDVAGTVTAAHATLTRVDSLYVQVNDNIEDTSGLYSLVVGVADGTPGGAAGTVPTRAMLLATLSRASAAAGGAVTVTWAPPKIAAAGGVIPVENTTVRDLITWGTPLNPALVYRADADMIERNVGAGWDHVAGGTPAVSSSAWSTPNVYTNTFPGTDVGSSFVWTPTRSGIATAILTLDLQQATTGYVLFAMTPRVNGGAISRQHNWFGPQRNEERIVCDPFRVRAGVAMTLDVQVSLYSAAGSVTRNGGTWRVSVT